MGGGRRVSFPQQPTHTRVEFNVEPEPELVSMCETLRLPATWSLEQRVEFHNSLHADEWAESLAAGDYYVGGA